MPLEVCLGFHKKGIVFDKGKDNETIVDCSALLQQTYVSKIEGNVVWYPEPNFVDGDRVGTFRNVNCLRAAYKGLFFNGMCKNCASIESMKSFRQRAISANHIDALGKTNYAYLTPIELQNHLRVAKDTESTLKDNIFCFQVY